MIGTLSKLATWAPLEPGRPASPLSLTADDGTWIKLPDFKGHLNVLLVFFRSLTDEGTDAFLRELNEARERFEQLDTAIFGVNTSRTDTLRAYRNRLGLEFFLLYDPFALAARGFRASGRVRPFCKDTVVLVGKDGKLLHSARGFGGVEDLLRLAAEAEGKAVPPARRAASDGFVRTPGKASAAVGDIDSNEAIRMLEEGETPYLLIDVRTKAEFDTERAPMARHIPVDELPHRYQELKQTTHLIFVCQGGGRSASAAEFMTSIGASHVYNVVGGMSQWAGPRVGAAVRETT